MKRLKLPHQYNPAKEGAIETEIYFIESDISEQKVISIPQFERQTNGMFAIGPAKADPEILPELWAIIRNEEMMGYIN